MESFSLNSEPTATASYLSTHQPRVVPRDKDALLVESRLNDKDSAALMHLCRKLSAANSQRRFGGVERSADVIVGMSG